MSFLWLALICMFELAWSLIGASFDQLQAGFESETSQRGLRMTMLFLRERPMQPRVTLELVSTASTYQTVVFPPV